MISVVKIGSGRTNTYRYTITTRMICVVKIGTGRNNTYRYTVTTRMTPALRQAAMRVILMFY